MYDNSDQAYDDHTEYINYKTKLQSLIIIRNINYYSGNSYALIFTNSTRR